MSKLMPILPLVVLLGCAAGEAGDEVCSDLCDELVSQCGVQAYPSHLSCESGCAYEAQNGADVDAHLDCVVDADCDGFAIVECDHAHGL